MKESIFNEICKEYGLTKSDSRFIKGSYWYSYRNIEICEKSASGLLIGIQQMNKTVRLIQTEVDLRKFIESCIEQIKKYEIEKKIEDMNKDFE